MYLKRVKWRNGRFGKTNVSSEVLPTKDFLDSYLFSSLTLWSPCTFPSISHFSFLLIFMDIQEQSFDTPVQRTLRSIEEEVDLH